MMRAALRPPSAAHSCPTCRSPAPTNAAVRSWLAHPCAVQHCMRPAARAARCSAAAQEALRPALTAADDEPAVPERALGVICQVQEVLGIRLKPDPQATIIEYLVSWKDGHENTWEPAGNLSEDLIRDYEESWWSAARKADSARLQKMLEGGHQVLPCVLDKNGRSALHFAAALGNVECTRLLVASGCDVNGQDKEGYTPLHMAAGYMHTAAIALLLQGGADASVRDNSGRDVVSLVDNLRGTMPLALETLQRRLALEQVCGVLEATLCEEVAPRQLLDERTGSGGQREFLVQYGDGHEDEWVAERNVSRALVEDWEAGLELADAKRVVDMVQYGYERVFLVEWEDGREVSWESEENVSPVLVEEFRGVRPELFVTFSEATRDAADANGVVKEKAAAWL